MVSLTKTMERLGLGAWKRTDDRVALTKAEFLELVTELAGEAIRENVRAELFERKDAIRTEGALAAVRRLHEVEAFIPPVADVVRAHLRDLEAHQHAGTLVIYNRRIIPPGTA